MGWTPNMDEGYLDGLHGRNNRECSPNYVEGWEAGWRERSRITSTTAFWVQTDAPEGLKLAMRRGLEKSMEGDFETDSMRYKATERYAFGFTDPRGVYGTPGI